MKYFSNLPVISYGNNYVRNILTRVKFTEEYKKNSKTYYPYVQQEGLHSLRYDNLAFDYYDDSDDVWIIHLFNEILDPYYDVALTQEDFSKFLTKKYGSVRNAYQKVAFYRNNYDQDDTVISESGYNALTQDVKRYWKPNVNFDNKIIGYDRARFDVMITTNRILQCNVSLVSNALFTVGEKVNQGDSSGFVTLSNTTIVNIQHIVGSISSNSYIVGEESGANGLVSSVTTIYNSFDNQNFEKAMSPEEEVYYSPVSIFDYENELNEQKKQIALLNKNLVPDIHSKFRELMQDEQ
jgi:hypothetical protein